ncbi:ammonium transporter [Brevundimonas sp.]|uniref:ammonium transporter n=1 Tax=Brevundimonas sp. TaxID=1871086 RepID=UPI002B6BB3EF|nr:ammonium transporter [Brevundimonas sp.]HWQ88122.1 ammonium transporter [Brevundimonas sp.]
MTARLLAFLVVAISILGAAPALAAAPAPALLAHQAPLGLNEASSAWILTSTALVLLMTLPGLALFYGGMVRRKNVIATIAHSTAALAIVTVLWFAVGYSLSFGSSAPSTNGFIGGLQAAFLNGVTPSTAHSLAPGLPEFLWIAYQLTFAIITPALIAGAFAERIKFSASILFFFLWHLLVYVPICHQVWGGGWMGSLGVLDFAGGAVVHVNAGVAGLVCALVLGPRHGHGRDNMAPHNLAFTAIGTGLLFVGWLGFNAGSAWAADGIAAVAALNTILAAAAAAIGWTAVEWIDHKRPTLLGLLSGIVAGLVGITPAAGLVDPKGAFIIGILSGPACYAGAVWLKRAFKYDDSLDAFGVHGVGGVVGALLTGVLATAAINPAAANANLLNQAIGLAAVIAWSGIGTFLILMICKFTTGLRVAKEEEIEGLDYTQHGETIHQ